MRSEDEFIEDDFDEYEEEYIEEGEYSDEIDYEQLEQTYSEALNNEDYFDDHVEYFDEYVETFANESESSRANSDFNDEECDPEYDYDDDDEEYDDDDEGMGIAGKLAIGLGIAVAILAIVTVVSLLIVKSKSTKDLASQIVYHEEMIGVGSTLEDIDVIGGAGLDAAILARKEESRKLAEAGMEVITPVVEEEETDYEEAELSSDVTVTFETISILKDLKVKLVNKSTGRLIANVPFSITVTYPDGSTKTWDDDDKDGIIYTKDLNEGSYSIHLVELEGDRYKDYTLPADIKAEVKGKIEYEAVDVADEILDSSKVDEAKEDTARDGADAGNEQATTLTNTVDWVESTSTDVYVAVDKSKIQLKVPVASLDGHIFIARVLDAGAGAPGVGDPGAGDPGAGAPSITVTIDDISDVYKDGQGSATVHFNGITQSDVDLEISPSDNSIATVFFNADDTISINGISVGSATITIKSKADGSVLATKSFNVIESTPVQSIAVGTISNILIGTTGTATVTLGGGLTSAGVTVTSANTAIATAVLTNDTTLTVTGVAAGTTTITLASSADSTIKAELSVTITKPATGIILSSTSASVYNGKTVTIATTLTNLTKDKVTVESSNNAVATAVLTNDNTLTITGVAAGTATITLKETADSTVNTSITITVIGSSEKLVLDGEQLYVSENGTYREATYADYSGTSTFYKKTKKYTGWQTLGGNTYYYKADGTYVTGEQVINGMIYNFDSKGALVVGGGVLGIDVSKWQGRIDWNKVKAAGVSYVIIRIGYRGSTQGGLIDDSMFRTNIEGAIAAGLKVGVYWVTQAVNEVEAVEEASAVLSRIAGYRISYPIYLDVERSGGRGDNIDKQTRTNVCKAFCQTIQNAGYTAGVYANKNWFTNYIDPSQLSGYKIWVAQYYTSCTFTGKYDMWQYTDKGSIDGISGNVDLNMSYLGY